MENGEDYWAESYNQTLAEIDDLIRRNPWLRKPWEWNRNYPMRRRPLTPAAITTTTTTITSTTTAAVTPIADRGRSVYFSFNEADYSPTVITCVVLVLGILVLVYALRCKRGCQEWKNDVQGRRNAAHPRHPHATGNEVVIEVPIVSGGPLEQAMPIVHLVTLLPLTPTASAHSQAPPPSYESATAMVPQPPKYEDCVR